MKTIKTLEDRITSLRAITSPMLLVNIAFAIVLSSLLFEVFEVQNVYLKYVASFCLAIGIGWTVLNTSVNSYLIHKHIPIVFAFSSLFLLLIKFKVFQETEQHFSWYITRVYLSMVGAATEYIFSHLFVKKNQETKAVKESKLEKQRLETHIAEHKQELSELKQEVSEMKQTKSELEEEIAKEKQVYCKECKRTFKNQNAFNAHKCKPKLKEIQVEFEEVIPD